MSYTRVGHIEAIVAAGRYRDRDGEAPLAKATILRSAFSAPVLRSSGCPPRSPPAGRRVHPRTGSDVASSRRASRARRPPPPVPRPEPRDLRAEACGRRLLERARAASTRWTSVTAARASGFNTHLAKRAPGDDAIGYLHAEHRRFSADRHILDLKRPESLIYATQPGRRPVLIGVMFSVPRGARGPTPAGRSTAGTPTSSA